MGNSWRSADSFAVSVEAESEKEVLPDEFLEAIC